jgi:hypothetical protein
MDETQNEIMDVNDLPLSAFGLPNSAAINNTSA